jgi:hypothetical protein
MDVITVIDMLAHHKLTMAAVHGDGTLVVVCDMALGTISL